MPSKTMQLFLALGLAATLGACSGPGGDSTQEGDGATDSIQPTTEETTPTPEETTPAPAPDEGGEGGPGGEG